MMKAFVAESKTWAGHQAILAFLRRESYQLLPVFRYVLENQVESGSDPLVLPQIYLNARELSISMSREIEQALKKGLGSLSHDEQLAVVLYGHYPRRLFPELALIADRLGTSSDKLINIHANFSRAAIMELQPGVLRYLFLYAQEDLEQNQKISLNEWAFLLFPWNLDHETTQQGVQLLDTLVKMLPQHDSFLQDTFTLFLSLLTFNTAIISYAEIIFPYLSTCDMSSIWIPSNYILNLAGNHLKELEIFVAHNNASIKKGAITFWAELIEIIHDRSYEPFSEQNIKLDNLNFDYHLCLSLIKEADGAQRTKGIILLTYSHFPIKETQYFSELLNSVEQVQNDEIAAWVLFLRHVPINKPEKKTWMKLLETLLAAPQKYSSEILAAAMERYMQLVGVVGPEIKNEQELGLPVLSPPKNRRAKR